jgi:hypothetical protein
MTYCAIIIIKTKQLFKQVKHEKLTNIIINQHFQTLYLKRSNNDVCLADTFFGCGDLDNRHSVVLLLLLIRLHWVLWTPVTHLLVSRILYQFCVRKVIHWL